MIKSIYKSGICITVIVSILLLSSQNQAYTKTVTVNAKSSAYLSLLTGKAYHFNKNKWVKLSKGNIIKPNNKIRTDKNSKAEITFSDGSRVRLDSNTDILLVKERSNNNHGLINIFKGNLWANIINKSKNRFAISSNTASLAVLGTTFNVEAENKETEISVFSGSIGVQSLNQNNTEFNKKLDKLNLIIDDKKTTNIQKPDKINTPVYEIEKPYKLVAGPYQVSQDKWLEIVSNQVITIDNKGNGTVSDLKTDDIEEDEWVQWNKELDSDTSENILFDK